MFILTVTETDKWLIAMENCMCTMLINSYYKPIKLIPSFLLTGLKFTTHASYSLEIIVLSFHTDVCMIRNFTTEDHLWLHWTNNGVQITSCARTRTVSAHWSGSVSSRRRDSSSVRGTTNNTSLPDVESVDEPSWGWEYRFRYWDLKYTGKFWRYYCRTKITSPNMNFL